MTPTCTWLETGRTVGVLGHSSEKEREKQLK